jgi:protein-arginine kinase
LEFAKTAQALDRNLRQVPLMNVQAQFRVILDRLVEETSSLSLKDVKELDSKELIRKFLMKPDLYRNIEMVVQAIFVGA